MSHWKLLEIHHPTRDASAPACDACGEHHDLHYLAIDQDGDQYNLGGACAVACGVVDSVVHDELSEAAEHHHALPDGWDKEIAGDDLHAMVREFQPVGHGFDEPSDEPAKYARRKSMTGQKSIEWDESEHPRSDDGKFADKSGGQAVASVGEAVKSGARRTRKTVHFDRPIVGPSGASLHSYDWKWMWEEGPEHDDPVRVSDWGEAELNEHTGRDIVHHFSVFDADGKQHTTSLETALKVLGFGGNSEGASKVKNLAMAAMQLAEQEQAHERLLEADAATKGKHHYAYDVRRSQERIDSLKDRVANLTKEAARAASGKSPAQHYREVAKRSLSVLDVFHFRPGSTGRWPGDQVSEIAAANAPPRSPEIKQIWEEGRRVYTELAIATRSSVYGGSTPKTPIPDEVPETSRFGKKVKAVPAWSDSKIRNWYFDNGEQAETAVQHAEEWLRKYHPDYAKVVASPAYSHLAEPAKYARRKQLASTAGQRSLFQESGSDGKHVIWKEHLHPRDESGKFAGKGQDRIPSSPGQRELVEGPEGSGYVPPVLPPSTSKKHQPRLANFDQLFLNAWHGGAGKSDADFLAELKAERASRVEPAKVEQPAGKEPWQLTYGDLRNALNPSTREELQAARPLLAAMYPPDDDRITATEGDDPWGIHRAITKGDETPRVPMHDLSFRHKAAIRKAIAEGKSVPAEVLADYDEFKQRKNVQTGRLLEAEPQGSVSGDDSEPARPVQDPNPTPAGVGGQPTELHAAVGKRFGIPPEAVRDLLSTSPDELAKRDKYLAPSSSRDEAVGPTTDYPQHAIGTAKIDSSRHGAGETENAYVDYLREFDPHALKLSEHEDGMSQSGSVKAYADWAKAGHKPPPISVFDSSNGNGDLVSTNRRRVLAARAAGTQLTGWHGPTNPETGLPLKYGDVLKAAKEFEAAGATPEQAPAPEFQLERGKVEAGRPDPVPDDTKERQGLLLDEIHDLPGQKRFFGGEEERAKAAASHPKPGDKFTMPASHTTGEFEAELVDAGDGRVGIKRAGTDSGALGSITKVKAEQLPQFLDDLHGKLSGKPNSPNESVNAAIRGDAKLLGRGNDGLAFDAGDGNVVKAASDVPFHWNNGLREQGEGGRSARAAVELNEKLRAAGIPGLLPQQVVEHEGRVYTVMPKLDTESPLTQEHIDQLKATMNALHESGHTIGDDLQAGIGQDGKAYVYDTGAIRKQNSKYDVEDDGDRLSRLAEKHGREFKRLNPHLDYHNAMESALKKLNSGKVPVGPVSKMLADKLESAWANLDADTREFYEDEHKETLAKLRPAEPEQPSQSAASVPQINEDVIHNWDSPHVQKEWAGQLSDEQKADVKQAFRQHHQKGIDAKKAARELVEKWSQPSQSSEATRQGDYAGAAPAAADVPKPERKFMSAGEAAKAGKSYADWTGDASGAYVAGEIDDEHPAWKAVQPGAGPSTSEFNDARDIHGQHVRFYSYGSNRHEYGTVTDVSDDAKTITVTRADGSTYKTSPRDVDHLGAFIGHSDKKGRDSSKALEYLAPILAKEFVESGENISVTMKKHGLDPVKSSGARNAIIAEADKLREAAKPQPSEARQRAMDKQKAREGGRLTREQFEAEYRKEFAAANKYGPNVIGGAEAAERMARLADEYPEWAEEVEAAPEPKAEPDKSRKWTKNEDGTYTDSNGTIWKKAAAGGEISPVTGERYEASSFMPIHGLHKKPDVKPTKGKGVASTPAKPNEGKERRPIQPLTAEQRAERLEQEERNKKWSEMSGGAMGKLKWMGERPNEKGAKSMIGTDQWMEYVQSLGPEKAKAMADKLESLYGERLNAAIEREAREGDDPDELAKWSHEEIGRRAAETVNYKPRTTKRHDREFPGSFRARQHLIELLDAKNFPGGHNNSVDHHYELHQLLEDAKKDAPAAAEADPREALKASNARADELEAKLEPTHEPYREVTDQLKAAREEPQSNQRNARIRSLEKKKQAIEATRKKIQDELSAVREEGQKHIAAIRESEAAPTGARRATPEGMAKIEAAKQKAREAVNATYDSPRERADAIVAARDAVAVAQVEAQSGKPYVEPTAKELGGKSAPKSPADKLAERPETATGDHEPPKPELHGSPKLAEAAIKAHEALAKAGLAAPVTEETKKKMIEDFGEKIGGARKDRAKKQAPKTEKANDERPVWQRRYNVGQITKSTDKSEEGQWFITDTKDTNWAGSPKQYGPFPSKEEAERGLPMLAVSRNHFVTTDRGDRSKYGVYRKIGDRKLGLIKGGFDTRDEAMAHIAADPVSIMEHKFPDWEDESYLDNVTRTGPDRRKGDVSTTDFQKAFGFRGGEFGKWQMNKDGQESLNHAYDALHDLADAIGLPPKAVALNGELAIGFGSRGTGGKHSAKAHYEPGKRAVINLTKMKGAGSLAHEWFHALDNYVAKQAFGDPGSGHLLTSTRPYDHNNKARKEILDAWKQLHDAIHHKNVTEAVQSSGDEVDKLHKLYDQSIEKSFNTIDQRLEDDKKWNKRYKPFTPEQRQEWDSLKKKVLAGDLGEQKYVDVGGRSAYKTFSNLEALNRLHKAATGRLFHTTNADSEGRRIMDAIDAKRYAVEKLEKANAGETKTRRKHTDFARAAAELDETRTQNYYTLPHEMAARAFAAYIQDKVEEKGGKSEYLAAKSHNKHYVLSGAKPFPEGEERTAINAAFDRLFAALQHEIRADDKGEHVRLYSKDAA